MHPRIDLTRKSNFVIRAINATGFYAHHSISSITHTATCNCNSTLTEMHVVKMHVNCQKPRQNSIFSEFVRVLMAVWLLLGVQENCNMLQHTAYKGSHNFSMASPLHLAQYMRCQQSYVSDRWVCIDSILIQIYI
jgi:hypothetical protein